MTHLRIIYLLLIYQVHYCYQTTTTTKQTIEEKIENAKEKILDGEDMYLRSMTINMDAGARYFCWSIEMEPQHKFTINFKVQI